MRKSTQLLLSAAAGSASAPAIYWLLSEAVVVYEVWATSTATRSELANDMGLGILLLIIVLPGTLIGGALCSWLAWCLLRRGGLSRAPA